MNFREVEKKLCIYVDELSPKILAPDVEANALLCMGYIDHTAGLTYEALALANYCDGDYSIVWEAKDVSLKIRAESTNGKIIMPIENKVLYNKFKWRIELLENYYGDANVLECRDIQELDNFRHPDFPDDLAVIIVKEGLKPETIWVRANRVTTYNAEVILFKGELLNEPYADFGIHIGQEIECVSFVNDSGERILGHIVR